jgi:hypothetical protein
MLLLIKDEDISAEQQKRFLSYLDKKYGIQFTENPAFLKYVKHAFGDNHLNHIILAV